MVITVNNQVHSRALYDDIYKYVSPILKNNAPDNFYAPLRLSGESKSGWVIMDMNSIIIHIVLEDIREFYELDDIFSQNGTVFHY